jgi:hypothetical protein
LLSCRGRGRNLTLFGFRQANGHVQGGWQISQGGGSCTLGVPAVRISNGTNVWLTASHCSDTFNQLDYGTRSQPGLPYGIGSEIVDNTNTCGSSCREADVSLYSASVPIDLGTIARLTTSSNCENCSAGTEVNHNDSTIPILSTRSWNVEDEVLHKVGRTTGWTYGDVEETCFDIYPWYVPFTFTINCTDIVDYSSGKPPFSDPPVMRVLP